MFGTDLIGRPLEDVDTPALVIDADAMEANIRDMAAYFKTVPAALRPHAKTHKSPIVGRKQIEAGAVGITCAKLGEAEALQAGGVDDILIANQIVGKHKINRLVRLARHCDVAVAVDNEANAQQISDAAIEAGSTVRVLVEVNVGMNRCGVEPCDPALELAQKVTKMPGLRFFGLQGYEGHLQNKPSREDRVKLVHEALAPLMETRTLLESNGIEVQAVSGGGTGTFNITAEIPGFDEIQAGSYVFMDAKYGTIEGPREEFVPAIFLWATVMSRPTEDRAVADVGLKTATPEHGLPQVLDINGTEVLGMSEEHIRIQVDGDARQLSVGDKIRIQPGHVCTTVNLHDYYVVSRNGMVEAIWPVAGRGRSR